MSCGCRRETGSSASSGWCSSRGIWSTRSGRQPAWSRESAVAVLGRAVPFGSGQRDADLNNGAQFRDLCLLEKAGR